METQQSATTLNVVATRAHLQAHNVLQQARATLGESRQDRKAALALIEQSRRTCEAARAMMQVSRNLLRVSEAELRDCRLLPLVTLPVLSLPAETVEAVEVIEAVEEPLLPVEKCWLSIQEATVRGGMTAGAVRTALYKRRVSYIDFYGRKLIRTTDFDAYRASVRVGRPRKKATQDT